MAGKEDAKASAKANAKQENSALAKAARSAIAKSVLDISELQISCSGGDIELFGKVRAPRDFKGGAGVRKEFESLKNMIRSVRGVREVYGDRVTVFE